VNKSPSPTVVASKSKNWLLIKFREWHSWGGIIAAAFLLVTATTGILLNYKEPILGALGLDKSPKQKMGKKEKEHKIFEKIKSGQAAALRADMIGSLPVTFEHALKLAKEQWGDVPLENIQLKDEHGQLIYKVKQPGGDELWIDAKSGEFFVKAQYEKVEMTGAMSKASKTFDWGKLALDLHTGKIGGAVGKAVMTGISVILLLLTVSGIYLWTVPIWRKRQAKKNRAVAAPAKVPIHSKAPRKQEDLIGV
jgi:uncharacterized iron-regulated membrane protein